MCGSRDMVIETNPPHAYSIRVSRELRKGAQHECAAHERGDVARRRGRVTLAAAENEPPICAQRGNSSRQKRLSLTARLSAISASGFFQRRGGDEIIRYRHDPPGDARFQAAQQRIAGKHAITGPHQTPVRMRDNAVARV